MNCPVVQCEGIPLSVSILDSVPHGKHDKLTQTNHRGNSIGNDDHHPDVKLAVFDHTVVMVASLAWHRSWKKELFGTDKAGHQDRHANGEVGHFDISPQVLRFDGENTSYRAVGGDKQFQPGAHCVRGDADELDGHAKIVIHDKHFRQEQGIASES